MKKIVAITINKKEDPELIAKINAVVPYQYKAAHTMVKDILHECLDKQIAELGISVYLESAQPSVG